nr:hypothetical protein [Tanacetum cinerariifolium]
MATVVARGHVGDGAGDSPPPSMIDWYRLPRGLEHVATNHNVGGSNPSSPATGPKGLIREGPFPLGDQEPEDEGAWEARMKKRKDMRQATRNIEFKKVLENYSPREIEFDRNDQKTFTHVGEIALWFSNFVDELVTEFSLHYPSWWFPEAACNRSASVLFHPGRGQCSIGLSFGPLICLVGLIAHYDDTDQAQRPGERNVANIEVKLLTLTEGRVVSLPEQPTERDDDVLAETVAKDGSKVVIEKTKKSKRKRKAIGDASDSTLPPKKLREDYHAVTSNIGGKSLAAIRGLILEGSSVSSDVTEPRVVAFVTPTPDCGNDGPIDSESGLNLRTHPPAMRYFVSSDDSHRSVSKGRVKSGNLDNFGDPVSAGGANAYVAVNTEFNVGATRQMYLGGGSEDASGTYFEQKYKLEDKCVEQAVLLSEKDTKIADLKSLLSLKEAKAIEAIRLRGQLSVVEAADATKGNELKGLKEKNLALEEEKKILFEKVTTLEFVTAAKETELVSLSAQVAKLTFDISSLESAFEIFKGRMEAMQDEQAMVMGNRVAKLDAQLLEMAAHLEEEFYPCFLTTISGRRWILTHGLKLDGLKAGIDHGKAGRDLSVVEAYDPFAEAKYVDAVNALRIVDFSLLFVFKSKKDACMADLMDSLHLEGRLAEIPKAKELQPSLEQLKLPIHRAKDDVVLGETSLSFSLQASTSAIPATTKPITTLSTTFASSGVVPPLSVSDYQVSDAEPHDEDPPAITFEEEELDTTPKSAVVS